MKIGLRKWDYYGAGEFFSEILISKMGGKTNMKIITKSYVADQEKKSPRNRLHRRLDSRVFCDSVGVKGSWRSSATIYPGLEICIFQLPEIFFIPPDRDVFEGWYIPTISHVWFEPLKSFVFNGHFQVIDSLRKTKFSQAWKKSYLYFCFYDHSNNYLWITYNELKTEMKFKILRNLYLFKEILNMF